MAVILLVEDEILNQKIVQASLSQHQVVVAATLADARAALNSKPFDLLLLDVQLPDGDGFSFFMEVQTQIEELDIPVVFLTGRMDVTDKVTGYSLGADDYITKPIHPVEFKARIEAKLRKQEMRKSKVGIFRKDGFVFSMEKQTVAVEKQGELVPIEMTALEFKLFHYLIKHKDHVLSRETLIADVWGGNLNINDRAIDTHMSHLRKKLKDTSLSVQSVYGAGYRLCSAKQIAS